MPCGGELYTAVREFIFIQKVEYGNAWPAAMQASCHAVKASVRLRTGLQAVVVTSRAARAD
jgi:hypothetical protein